MAGGRLTTEICWAGSTRRRSVWRGWLLTQNYFLRLYDSSSPPKYSRVLSGACMLIIRCENLSGTEGIKLMGVSDRDLMLKAIDIEFQREVLDKLVRLETKMDALVGNGQPGRMKTGGR